MGSHFGPAALLFVCVLPCMAHAGSRQKTPKQTAAKSSVTISGKELYQEHCAVCHGADARGGGPAARSLRVRPTDLTQLACRNEGVFPEERFLKTMHGEVAVAAHGAVDMPVWGKVLSRASSSPDLAEKRIHALMNYVEELQAR